MAFHAWICTLCICRPYSVCVLIATTSGNYSSLKERCRVKGCFGGVLAAWRAGGTGVSCFPDSRGAREPGAVLGPVAFCSVPMSGVIRCAQCRWLHSSLLVTPAAAGGHGARPRLERAPAG